MKKRLFIIMAAFTFAFGVAGFLAGSSDNGGPTTQELPTIF